MRVLVAEDDRGLREVLAQGLEEAGYFVDAVAAGDEAIDQLVLLYTGGRVISGRRK